MSSPHRITSVSPQPIPRSPDAEEWKMILESGTEEAELVTDIKDKAGKFLFFLIFG